MNLGPPLTCLGSSCEFQFPSTIKVSPGCPFCQFQLRRAWPHRWAVHRWLYSGLPGVWLAPITPVCNYTRRARNLDGSQAWPEEQRRAALADPQRDYVTARRPRPRFWRAERSSPGRCKIGVGVPLARGRSHEWRQLLGLGLQILYQLYLSKAEENHIQMYGEWMPDLTLEARRSIRRAVENILQEQHKSMLGPVPGPQSVVA